MALEGWSLAARAQLLGGAVRDAILFRVDSDPAIRVWVGGVGDIEIPADNIEPTDSARYSGLGQMVGLPKLNQLINGRADRADFGLAATGAVGAELAALASGSAGDVRNKEVNIGYLVFDAAWTIISPVEWAWAGVADVVKLAKDGKSEPVTRQISLSVASLLTGRRKPVGAYFTDADQKRRSADDDFFDQIKNYTQQTTIVWPQ